MFDGSGLCLLAKRLGKGRFACLWRARRGGSLRLSRAELGLFLEGSQVVGRKRLVPENLTQKELAIRSGLVAPRMCANIGAKPSSAQSEAASDEMILPLVVYSSQCRFDTCSNKHPGQNLVPSRSSLAEVAEERAPPKNPPNEKTTEPRQT